MNWLFWKLHYKQVLLMGCLLAAYAIFIYLTGRHIPAGEAARFYPISNVVMSIVRDSAVAPLLIGLFWGAPLFAREFEEGTNKLAWTQGISRRKWLAVKFGWMVLLATVSGTIYACLTTWWWKDTIDPGRFEGSIFNITGLMPVAYSLFALTIGAALGAWRRRSIVAIAGTLFAFLILPGIIGTYIRPHYMPPLTYTYSSHDCSITKTPGGGTSMVCEPITSTAYLAAEKPGNWHINSGPEVIVYQPASRYWSFQLIEATIYIGLSAPIVAAMYYLVIRRDA